MNLFSVMLLLVTATLLLSGSASARTVYLCQGVNSRYVDGPGKCTEGEEETSFESTPWVWSCLDYVAAPEEQRVAYVAGWWKAQVNEEYIRRGNFLFVDKDRDDPSLLTVKTCSATMTADNQAVRELSADPQFLSGLLYGAFGMDPRKYAHKGFIDAMFLELIFGPAPSSIADTEPGAE